MAVKGLRVGVLTNTQGMDHVIPFKEICGEAYINNSQSARLDFVESLASSCRNIKRGKIVPVVSGQRKKWNNNNNLRRKGTFLTGLEFSLLSTTTAAALIHSHNQ